MGEQGHAQAVQKCQGGNGRGHDGKTEQAQVVLGIHEQGEKSHVKNNGLGVEQGDGQSLLKILPRPNVQDGRIAGLGRQHLPAQPGQVHSAQPLNGHKRRRVGGQHRRHTRHRQPHQHLVPGNHTQSGHEAPGHATFAGGGDQGQIARTRNGQKHHNGRHKCAVIRDAEKHGLSFEETVSSVSDALAGESAGVSRETSGSVQRPVRPQRQRIRHLNQWLGRIHTMQRSTSRPGTLNGST